MDQDQSKHLTNSAEIDDDVAYFVIDDKELEDPRIAKMFYREVLEVGSRLMSNAYRKCRDSEPDAQRRDETL